MNEAIAIVTDPSEATRLSQRRSIRQRLAEIDFKQRRIDELSEQIAEHDRRIDMATDDHERKTRPIQERLKELEESIKAALTERQPVAEADEAERKDLLAQLTEANRELENIVSTESKLKEPLTKERSALWVEVAPRGGLESQLAREGVGNPALLDELFCAQQEVRWLNFRLREAKEKLEAVKSAIAAELSLNYRDPRLITLANPSGPSAENLETYRRRERRWQREVDAAEKRLREARDECDGLHQRILDE